MSPQIFFAFKDKGKAQFYYDRFLKEGIKNPVIKEGIIGINVSLDFDPTPASYGDVITILRKGIIKKFNILEEEIRDVENREVKKIKPSEEWKVDEEEIKKYIDLSILKKPTSLEELKGEIFQLIEDKEQKEARYRTALRLSQNDHFSCMLDNRELYVYNQGIYEEGGENYVKTRIRELWEKEATIHDKREIISAIKDITSLDRGLFVHPNKIVLENGILDIPSMKLEPLSPDKKFLSKIPVKYDPKANCPQVKKFLSMVMGGEYQATFFEIIGSIISPSFIIRQLHIFRGDHSTGKTTTLRLLENFCGDKNFSSVGLGTLGKRFGAINLYSKNANICDELPKQIQRTDRLKALSGGGTIYADIKGVKGISFKNTATPIFAGNHMPEIADEDAALWDRIKIIPFENQFKGENERQMNDILKELTTKKELSGLLNEGLKGLGRLKEKLDFSYYEGRDYAKMFSSGITGFAYQKLKPLQGSSLLKNDVLNECNKWLEENMFKTISLKQLTTGLKQIPNFNIYGKTGGKKPRYMNIGWKEEVDEVEKIKVNRIRVK